MSIDRDFKWHVLLSGILLVSLLPIVFAVSTSFKDLSEAYSNVMGLIPWAPTLENYQQVFSRLPLLTAKVQIRLTCMSFLSICKSSFDRNFLVWFQLASS